MTFKQYYNEEYLKTSNKGYAMKSGVTNILKGIPVEIWKNPSQSEVSKFNAMRLVLWATNLYAWQSDTSSGWLEHRHAMQEIGVNVRTPYVTMTYDKRHGLEVAWYEMGTEMNDKQRANIKKLVETNKNVIKLFGNIKLGNI